MFPSKSVWTIDLFCALRECGSQCDYYTTSLGAQETHTAFEFYQETNFKDDCRRVNGIFADCVERGLSVYERHLVESDLSNILLSGKLIILLVNEYALGKDASPHSSMFHGMNERS
mgnify:CR=1 FL=1